MKLPGNYNVEIVLIYSCVFGIVLVINILPTMQSEYMLHIAPEEVTVWLYVVKLKLYFGEYA